MPEVQVVGARLARLIDDALSIGRPHGVAVVLPEGESCQAVAPDVEDPDVIGLRLDGQGHALAVGGKGGLAEGALDLRDRNRRPLPVHPEERALGQQHAAGGIEERSVFRQGIARAAIGVLGDSFGDRESGAGDLELSGIERDSEESAAARVEDVARSRVPAEGSSLD